MSAATTGFLALALALCFIAVIIWQFKTRNFVDPIFSAFAPTAWTDRPLWCAGAIYGALAIEMMWVGLKFLTKK